MLANGKKKAAVVAKALEGPVTSQVTASAIQLFRGEAIVVLDKEAASELKNTEFYMHREKLMNSFSFLRVKGVFKRDR